MEIGILVLFSLIVKCLGAILEIGSQAIISQLWSVSTYGTYAFFISLSEVFYSLFFSGIIKFNNYYISQGYDLQIFKKKYYLYYALPISFTLILASLVTHNSTVMFAFVAGFVCLCDMDISSQLMSKGNYKPALVGEYCVGRAFLILIIFVLSIPKNKKINSLYIAYCLQFCVLFIYYFRKTRKVIFHNEKKCLGKDVVPKYAVYQSTEIAHMIVMQTPIIVQYLFGGAFQAALISIVLVVRKTINFISGPASKLYQPEFAKRNAEKNKRGLIETYEKITKVQLCFMLPIFAFLLTSPELILYVFNSELLSYGWLVKSTSLVFLSMVIFGPLSNLLPMVGKEKIDTIINWTSVLIMYFVMVLLHDNQYFVVIGFCAQILYVNLFKLIVFILTMKCFPMSIKYYLQFLIIFFLSCLLIILLPKSFFISIGVCLIHIITNFFLFFPKKELHKILRKFQMRGENADS